MADHPLAASLVGDGKLKNEVVPTKGQPAKARIVFTQLPRQATDVRVEVLETMRFHDGRATITDRFAGAFAGQVRDGLFSVQGFFLPRLPRREDDPVLAQELQDPLFVDFALAGQSISLLTPPAERVTEHTLRLRVSGRVKGRLLTPFEGSSRISVQYGLAMVVPAPRAGERDPAFARIRCWADQWKRRNPNFRTVHFATIMDRPTDRGPRQSDYTDLVQKLTDAARAAKAGVVALATGHGDPGEAGKTIPWFNLVPENEPPRPFRYKLDIDDLVLRQGIRERLGNVQLDPGTVSCVKLQALDSLGVQLPNTPLRRLLLHTCKLGRNIDFLRLLASRIRVPVLSQTKTIAYTKETIRAGSGESTTCIAGYDLDPENEQAPLKDEQIDEWPVSRLGPVVTPGRAPLRWVLDQNRCVPR